MSETTTNEKSRPVRVFRAGGVSVAVFVRERDGLMFYSAKADRSYQDKRTNEWKHTDYMGRDDMAVAAELFRLAFAWTCEQQAQKVEPPVQGETGGRPF